MLKQSIHKEKLKGRLKEKKEEKQKTNMNVSIFNVKRPRHPPVDLSNNKRFKPCCFYFCNFSKNVFENCWNFTLKSFSNAKYIIPMYI